MAATFRFDRRWPFPCSAEALWALLERVDEYPCWWPFPLTQPTELCGYLVVLQRKVRTVRGGGGVSVWRGR